MHCRSRGIVPALVLLLVGRAQAGLITINSNQTQTRAQQGNPPQTLDGFFGTTFPTSVTRQVVDGDSNAQTDIDFHEQSGQTVLDFHFSHNRSGEADSFAQSQTSLVFTAQMDTVYNLTGFYDVSGFDGMGTGTNLVNYEALLTDLTASANLFNSRQQSDDTSNEEFDLGGSGGDVTNLLSGSPAGNLILGHQYFLSFSSFISAFDFETGSISDDGASATGRLTLTIGETTNAVPEPSSFALLGSGGLTLFGCGRRRWRRRSEGRG